MNLTNSIVKVAQQLGAADNARLGAGSLGKALLRGGDVAQRDSGVMPAASAKAHGRPEWAGSSSLEVSDAPGGFTPKFPSGAAPKVEKKAFSLRAAMKLAAEADTLGGEIQEVASGVDSKEVKQPKIDSKVEKSEVDVAPKAESKDDESKPESESEGKDGFADSDEEDKKWVYKKKKTADGAVMELSRLVGAAGKAERQETNTEALRSDTAKEVVQAQAKKIKALKAALNGMQVAKPGTEPKAAEPGAEQPKTAFSRMLLKAAQATQFPKSSPGNSQNFGKSESFGAGESKNNVASQVNPYSSSMPAGAFGSAPAYSNTSSALPSPVTKGPQPVAGPKFNVGSFKPNV